MELTKSDIAIQARKTLVRQSMLDFSKIIHPRFDINWHHEKMAEKLTLFGQGKIKKMMIFMPPQHGKFFPEDTPVWTPKGWVCQGDLEPGDKVFGPDGKPKTVEATTSLYDWLCLDVEFNDGNRLSCAPEHEWDLVVEYDDHKGRIPRLMETGEIFDRKHRRSPYIPITEGLRGHRRKLPVDPYLLGCWLGDGTSSAGALTTGTQDVEHFKMFGRPRKHKGREVYSITAPHLKVNLRKAGILNNKHIPLSYLTASPKVRRELLMGLMDTDGYVDLRGNCEFSQKAGRLAEDVKLLISTLGYKGRSKTYRAMLDGRDVGEKVRIGFNPDRTDQVFKLERKAERLRNKSNGDQDDKKKHFIKSVSKDGVVRRGNCIQVEGGRYLVGMELIPTHNSSFGTEDFASWNFGNNPDCKTAVVAYSYDKSREFNMGIQRIMDSPEYIELFPETRLADSEYSGTWGKKRRSNDIFEIMDTRETKHSGFLKSASVTGGLTGTPVDLLLVDDPVKDYIEANSITTRERNWNWWVAVAEARLHNDSQILFIMTRWHKDDLAGRILAAEGEEWEVVTFPAIKENDLNPDDPREVGEALWPWRHSLERMLKVKQKSPYIFNSLYQQKPTPEGSGDFSREMFEYVRLKDVPEQITWDVMIDGAFSETTKNDPTGLMLIAEHRGDIYIRLAQSQFMKMPELLDYIPLMIHNHGIDYRSTIWIEPKASGVPLYQMLRKKKKYNVRKVFSRLVQMGKTSRAKAASAVVGGGHVYLVEGRWNEAFISQMTSFPNDTHDEDVDNFSYFVHIKFGRRGQRRGMKNQNG